MKNAADNSTLINLAKRISTHQPPQQVDVLVEDNGTLFIFSPLTGRAKQWIEENVSQEGYQPDFPTRLIVEHRYAFDLARGMRQDQLVVR